MNARLAGVAAAAVLAGCAAAPTPTVREPITVHAAGSLRAAMTDLAKAFEAAQVFASANMEHPQALQKAGVAVKVEPFATNALCALARGGFSLQVKTLAQRLLDPDVRVATSTPRPIPPATAPSACSS